MCETYISGERSCPSCSMYLPLRVLKITSIKDGDEVECPSCNCKLMYLEDKHKYCTNYCYFEVVDA